MIRSSQLLGGALYCGLGATNCTISSTLAGSTTNDFLARRSCSLVILSMGLPSKGNFSFYQRMGRHHPSATVVFLATGSVRDSVLGKCRLNTRSCIAGPFPVDIFRGGLTMILKELAGRCNNSACRSSVLAVGFSRVDTALSKGPLAFAPLRCQLLGVLVGGPRVILAQRILLRGL